MELLLPPPDGFLNNKHTTIFGDGEQTRDFVHVSDIVQANLLLLESNKALRGDEYRYRCATSVSTIAKLLANGLGRQLEAEIVGKCRDGDIRHCVADISLARGRLGYKPKVTVEDGMQELATWVRQQNAQDLVA